MFASRVLDDDVRSTVRAYLNARLTIMSTPSGYVL
jgi:hypothetical protein